MKGIFNRKKDVKEMSELERVEAKKGFSKKLAAAAMVAGASSAFASGSGGRSFGDKSDSFGDLLAVFIQWMQGNLGKLLALVGFIGTFVIYLMTHKGSVLFIGVIISIIAGGLVGIVSTFFSAGNKAFQGNDLTGSGS